MQHSIQYLKGSLSALGVLRKLHVLRRGGAGKLGGALSLIEPQYIHHKKVTYVKAGADELSWIRIVGFLASGARHKSRGRSRIVIVILLRGAASVGGLHVILQTDISSIAPRKKGRG